MRSQDYSKIASYLIDAANYGRSKACEMHGISSITGHRWHKQIETDLALQDAVLALREQMIPSDLRIEDAIAKQVQYMYTRIDDPAEKFDYQRMTSARENYKVMSEMALAHKLIDSKLKMLDAQRPSMKQIEQETMDAVAMEAK
jgi:hypothetical protein